MAWLDQLIKPFRSEAAPAFALGAFGKHPGWDDHLEDFGLETEALLAARQLLYVQGIGGLVDSGAWEKGPSSETAPPFGHLAVWFSEPDLLVARLWASQDRKGRDRYPMVICAHASQVDTRAALTHIVPELETIERKCRAETTAEAIQSLLETHRQRLREVVTAASAPSVPPPLPRARVAAQMGLTAESESWARVLYAAESQLAAFTPAKMPEAARRISMKMASIPTLAQHLRLPLGEAAPVEAMLFWRDCLKTVLQTGAPILFLQGTGLPWLDVIVGCPGVKQLFCLRASQAAIPLVQEVPYHLPDGFAAKAARTFRDFCG